MCCFPEKSKVLKKKFEKWKDGEKKVAKNMFFSEKRPKQVGLYRNRRKKKMLYVTSFVNFFNPRRLKALT